MAGAVPVQETPGAQPFGDLVLGFGHLTADDVAQLVRVAVTLGDRQGQPVVAWRSLADPPSGESEDTGGGAKVKEKTWIYFPAPGDAQTMTTLVIREGKVIRVDRRISR